MIDPLCQHEWTTSQAQFGDDIGQDEVVSAGVFDQGLSQLLEFHPAIRIRGMSWAEPGRPDQHLVVESALDGLTSGIDLALHVIGRYFGPETAEATARYMEHKQTERPT